MSQFLKQFNQRLKISNEEETQYENHFKKLPDETVLKILEFTVCHLNPDVRSNSTFCNIKLVNKRFHQIAAHPSFHDTCKRNFYGKYIILLIRLIFTCECRSLNGKSCCSNSCSFWGTILKS